MTNLYALRTLHTLAIASGPMDAPTVFAADFNLAAKRNSATFARILASAIKSAK